MQSRGVSSRRLGGLRGARGLPMASLPDGACLTRALSAQSEAQPWKDGAPLRLPTSALPTPSPCLLLPSLP